MSSWEHLQNVLIQVHNRVVREEFRDVDGSDDNISTSRASLRSASLVRDSDSATTAIGRLIFFYMTLRKASDMHPPLYTMPVDRYQQSVKFQPQISLYFKEDLADVEPGFEPLDSELSFRLQGKTEDNLSRADLVSVATRIRSEFSSGNGYRWRKGRISVNYRDKARGYQLRVQAFSESQGKEVIGKILDLQGDTIDRSKLLITQLDDTPPIIPPTKTIVGRPRRLPRRRPVGWVRFQFAEAHVWGVPNSIMLIDRTERRRNPLVTAR